MIVSLSEKKKLNGQTTLSIDEVEAYCMSPNVEARQNIICDAIRQSLCVYPFGEGVYFFEIGPNIFKKVGGNENDALKSLLQQFAAVSMLALRATSDGDDNARVKELKRTYPMPVAELDNFMPKNLSAYRMKLTLPEDFRMDCDLDGIHFANGRFNVRTGEFTERGFPDGCRPETFVSVYIPYQYAIPDKALCDQVFDSLLKSFGTREKLQYCLAYAGAALNGRSAATSCSCMFHVGIDGSGKATFVNWIKAAVTDVYYKDLPINTFDNMIAAAKTISEIAPSVRFLFAPELNAAPKNSSVLKCICDGEITTTKWRSNGSFDIKINAKLFCTSNNAIVFDEDDTGILRRVQYCLHQNRFVDGADLQYVDNVHVFAKEPLDMEHLDVSYRLAMFHLMASFAQAGVVERPEGIYDGSSLFDIEAFVEEYFDLEEGEKVAKEVVIQLAGGYFKKVEYREEYIINKLVKFPADPLIYYDKNRSHEGSRGILVNLCLNQKTLKLKKKGKLSEAAVAEDNVDWRASFGAAVSGKKAAGFGFGGDVAKASAVPPTVFAGFGSFGSSTSSLGASAAVPFGASAGGSFGSAKAVAGGGKMAAAADESDESDDSSVDALSEGVGEMIMDDVDEEPVAAKSAARRVGIADPAEGNNWVQKSKKDKKKEKKAFGGGKPMGMK